MVNKSYAKIIVRFRVVGFHCWPEAPDEVDYLRERHRHLFHVEVSTRVLHDDREIEFHMLQDMARVMFGCGEFGSRSCETLARVLGEKLVAHYKRPFTVGVSEDGEVEARVYVPTAYS